MKFVEFLKNWLFPIFSFIFTVLIIPFLWEYYVTVRPELQNIAKDMRTIRDDVEIIESRYTKSDGNGISCKIGISADKTGIAAYVHTSKTQSLNLKSGDVINISNPFDAHRASIWCTVSISEDEKMRSSDAHLFLSQEAMNKLGIKSESFKLGVFNMSFKISK